MLQIVLLTTKSVTYEHKGLICHNALISPFTRTPILKYMLALVNEIGGKHPCLHPTDNQLTVFTNGADHFICEVPVGHERFETRPVLRKATEEECKHHRRVYVPNLIPA